MPAQRRVALLFPGQGAQHIRMAIGLYRREPAFTEAIDEVFDAMGATGAELRTDWLAERPAVAMDHVTRSTPLLFAVDYALGRLVLDWGVRPAALLGHSAGEMAAAVLAGVFELPEAARLVCERVRVLATAPHGGMLAVAASEFQLRPYLGRDLGVAAVNAPRQTVLSGLTASIAAVEQRLRADGFACRRVPALSPFHSPVMAGLAVVETPMFARATMRPPRQRLFSAYTGGRLSDRDATDAAFWATHPSRPVLFWPALDRLLRTGEYLLVEAGPGAGLATLARLHPAVASGRSEVVAMLPAPPSSPDQELRAVRAVAARVFGAAVPASLTG
jgi:[acyl-carrier-protein] S-malonyltransferase